MKEWIEPGEHHFDGYHALWFARSREFSSDYERMVRQRCVQDAMVQQLDPSTLLLRFQDIAKAAPDVVSTDIPQVQVDRFVDLALKTRTAGTTSVDLTPPEVNPTHPDFAEVRQLVADTVAESEQAAEEAEAPGHCPRMRWARPRTSHCGLCSRRGRPATRKTRRAPRRTPPRSAACPDEQR